VLDDDGDAVSAEFVLLPLAGIVGQVHVVSAADHFLFNASSIWVPFG
jgi:hypothetical protein